MNKLIATASEMADEGISDYDSCFKELQACGGDKMKAKGIMLRKFAM